MKDVEKTNKEESFLPEDFKEKVYKQLRVEKDRNQESFCSSCSHCSDCSHCFNCRNVKGLNHAICNVELTKEEIAELRRENRKLKLISLLALVLISLVLLSQLIL